MVELVTPGRYPPSPCPTAQSLDHLMTLWGKRIVGVLGGSGCSDELMTTIMSLYAQGRSRSTASSSTSTWLTSRPRSSSHTRAR